VDSLLEVDSRVLGCLVLDCLVLGCLVLDSNSPMAEDSLVLDSLVLDCLRLPRPPLHTGHPRGPELLVRLLMVASHSFPHLPHFQSTLTLVWWRTGTRIESSNV